MRTCERQARVVVVHEVGVGDCRLKKEHSAQQLAPEVQRPDFSCLSCPASIRMWSMKPEDAVARYVRGLASRGGKARAKKLSARRRKQIAAKAGRTRWGRRKTHREKRP
jgi:hypothetical protein